MNTTHFDILQREAARHEATAGAIKAIAEENTILRREIHALRVELGKTPVNVGKSAVQEPLPEATHAPEPENTCQPGGRPVDVPSATIGKVHIFIVHPDDGSWFTPEQWKERAEKDGFDPTSAHWIAIVNEFGQKFLLHKNQIKEGSDDSDKKVEFKFNEALEKAKALDGATGTRKQWIDVYEAIYTAGLNDALELIGGDKITGKWYWTQEKDSDQSYANGAWVFYGAYGYLSSGYDRVGAYSARVFRAF